MSLLRSNSITALFTCLAVCLLVSPAQAKYNGVGNGEPNNPYQISDANDMNEIGLHDDDWGAHFIMVNDVNLAEYTGTEFNIIGTSSNDAFSGVFDGNNHCIFNFTYESTNNDYTGLFGYIDDQNAEVKNLGLNNPDVNAGMGDIVGSLVGKLSKGTVFNCYARGGSVSGNRRVGGLVGYNGSGFGGWTYVTISNCYATTAVSGSQNVGGLVGYNEGVDDESAFGGPIARISNCYAIGKVSGVGIPGNIVGGLVGFNGEGGKLINCYTAGIVNGDGDGGGLVGCNFGFIDKCFWDNSVNPSLTGGGPTDPNVIGKSTTEMQKESTFTDTDWDFVEIWNIGENQTYPYLRIYPAGDLNHNGIVNFPDFAIFADHWLAGVQE